MSERAAATISLEPGPRVAVVVATRNRGSKIAQLLQSIGASDFENFEMVIVDQSDDSSTQKAVRPFLADSRIRYVHTSVRGASRARNIGARMTSAPFIAITDDDCMVPPEWLSRMTRPFLNFSDVGVVFCSVVPVEFDLPGLTPSIVFDADRRICTLREAWVSRKGLSLGAGMSIRRSTFDELQGFDETLGPGSKFGACEDNDLSWRALRNGWSVYQLSKVQVLHDGFRPMDEIRALVQRDYYGVGGAIAKYIRAREPWSLWFLGTWVVSSALVGPVRDLVAIRRPRGIGRAFVLLQGVVHGLRMPCEADPLVYASAIQDSADPLA